MQLTRGYFVFAIVLIAAAWAENATDATTNKQHEEKTDKVTFPEADLAKNATEPNMTTTADPPATTTAATPDPDGDWKVTEDFDGKPFTCLHVKAEITFTKVFVDKKKAPEEFTLDSKAVVNQMDSSCGAKFNHTTKKVEFDGDQTLVLEENSHKVELTFTENEKVTKKSGRYALKQICLDGDCGPMTGIVANTDSSYFCTPRQNFTDVLNVTGGEVAVSFAHVQMQAFVHNSTTFGNQYQCEAMRSNDLVPIIVGSCLAALVVIVLIAYLIGRSRAKSSGTGYESV